MSNTSGVAMNTTVEATDSQELFKLLENLLASSYDIQELAHDINTQLFGTLLKEDSPAIKEPSPPPPQGVFEEAKAIISKIYKNHNTTSSLLRTMRTRCTR